MLAEKAKPLGIDFVVTYPGARQGKFANPTDYFIAKLKTE